MEFLRDFTGKIFTNFQSAGERSAHYATTVPAQAIQLLTTGGTWLGKIFSRIEPDGTPAGLLEHPGTRSLIILGMSIGGARVCYKGWKKTPSIFQFEWNEPTKVSSGRYFIQISSVDEVAKKVFWGVGFIEAITLGVFGTWSAINKSEGWKTPIFP